MYTQEAIDSLAKRHGWAAPIPPTEKTLTADNAAGSSGRLYSSFQQMVVVENVEATMHVSNANSGLEELISNTQLNAKLDEFRIQGAHKVLNRVFDANPLAQWGKGCFGQRLYIGATNYTAVIITRASSLDDCLGYQVAYDVLEMMLTTQRSNTKERGIAQAGEIMAAQRGYRDANGVLFEDGVLQRLEKAYATAIGLFFQSQDGPVVRNATPLW